MSRSCCGAARACGPAYGASLDEIYPNARIRAAVATRLADDALPDACPFTLDQITGEWLP
jgi:Domain of unknown function DUF29